MSFLDDIIDREKRRLEKARDEMVNPLKDVKKFKHGRTWEQVAMQFVRNVKKIMMPEGIIIDGSTMRRNVGNPSNRTFRMYVRKHGISIKKVSMRDLYRVKKLDRVKERLKENEKENIGLF